jgi:hypothetical protein
VFFLQVTANKKELGVAFNKDVALGCMFVFRHIHFLQMLTVSLKRTLVACVFMQVTANTKELGGMFVKY